MTICELLIDNGVNINQFDDDLDSALMKASEKGCNDIVKLLIENYKEDEETFIFASNKKGQDALTMAWKSGMSELFCPLICT